jgi:hypothetical protein
MSEIKKISFNEEYLIVKKVLKHLGLLKDNQFRAPPYKMEQPIVMIYEPFDDGWSHMRMSLRHSLFNRTFMRSSLQAVYIAQKHSRPDELQHTDINRKLFIS